MMALRKTIGKGGCENMCDRIAGQETKEEPCGEPQGTGVKMKTCFDKQGTINGDGICNRITR